MSMAKATKCQPASVVDSRSQCTDADVSRPRIGAGHDPGVQGGMACARERPLRIVWSATVRLAVVGGAAGGSGRRARQLASPPSRLKAESGRPLTASGLLSMSLRHSVRLPHHDGRGGGLPANSLLVLIPVAPEPGSSCSGKSPCQETTRLENRSFARRRTLAKRMVNSLNDLSERATRLLASFVRDSGTFELGSVEVFSARLPDHGDLSLRFAFTADRDPHEYGYTYFDVYFSQREPPQPEFCPHKFTVGFH